MGKPMIYSLIFVVLISSSALAGAVNKCVACHGVDGKSKGVQAPNLAGQNPAYLLKQIEDFKSGERESSIMEGFVKNLTDQELSEIIEYYSSLPPLDLWANQKFVDIGRQIYEEKALAAGFPACAGCHGENALGNAATGIPKLAGQNSSYLFGQITQFVNGTRSNDPAGVKQMLLESLTNEEMAAVSSYLQGLK